jgi:geranylgeranyl diphosphate synthase, type I
MDIKPLLTSIELELQKQVSRLDQPRTKPFHEMLSYHMGWTGDVAGPEATGKRIRPLMVLLTAAACNSDWTKALPAAAAVELVHNFSLVHDDIQDNSPKRRGRDTAWVKWGVPMAINVGDALIRHFESGDHRPERKLSGGELSQSRGDPAQHLP